jgi:hypothetical protein
MTGPRRCRARPPVRRSASLIGPLSSTQLPLDPVTLLLALT